MIKPNWLAAKHPSLQRYLLRWAMGVVLVVWLTLLAVAWGTGLRETSEFADGHLVSVARLWLQTTPPRQVLLHPTSLDDAHHEYQLDVAILEWTDEQLVLDSQDLASGIDLKNLPVNGFANVLHRSQQGMSNRRVYSMAVQQDGHQRRVAVFLRLDRTSALGTDIAVHVAEPALLIFPIVAFLLWWAIRRGLRPLEQLSNEVAALDGFTGQRMDTEHRFREFNSTVSAINALVDRLQRQAQRERNFASDVAHELRTPLTAMTLQANAAQVDPTPNRLAQLEQDSLRAGRILAQLLDLARAQRESFEFKRGKGTLVDIGELASQVVADHAQKAYEKDQELSLTVSDKPIRLEVEPLLLELALRNLIDNALQHTPPRTQVSVKVEQTATETRVSVSDDGPSRAPSDTASDQGGLGLGLRLVERIGEELNASLVRDLGASSTGTCFTLRWVASEVHEQTPV